MGSYLRRGDREGSREDVKGGKSQLLEQEGKNA